MPKENIISTLIKQHLILRDKLSILSKLMEQDNNFGEIDMKLKDFLVYLKIHLKLENDIFYVELIKQMEKKGQDTKKTKEFIAEMDGIAKIVLDFCDKYENKEKIKNNFDNFKKEIASISKSLILRIESEEAGVYSYWGLF